jgi:hypothetical protein
MYQSVQYFRADASAKRRHWILDAEQADRADPASVDKIGERIMTAIRPPCPRILAALPASCVVHQTRCIFGDVS